MNTLRDIREDLRLTLDDLGDLLEIVDLLNKNHIHKAKEKILNLDTAVRDYCVEYFNENMLRQVNLEGNGSQGKVTGKKYSAKQLAEIVEKGAALYVYQNLGYYKQDAKGILDAQKTNH